MEKKLNLLLDYAYKYNATDIHFVLNDNKLKITLRGINGIVEINNKNLDISLFQYLKYISNLDLGNSSIPQSGSFTYTYKNNKLFFRFAFMKSYYTSSGVLRLLNNHKKITINKLSNVKNDVDTFIKWTQFRSGLILISGPTGSGKSTTLNAILETIAKNNRLKVVSLEDPIEIRSDNYLQFQINEKLNFSYEEGIKQLLRHDPDVIMIGEIRDDKSAKMLIRAALSGHMIFTTIHAKTCTEAIKRLLDFNINENDLKQVLTGITNQRIYPKKGKEERICIYEIMERNEIIEYFNNENYEHQTDIFENIKNAYQKGWINKEQAEFDIEI